MPSQTAQTHISNLQNNAHTNTAHSDVHNKKRKAVMSLKLIHSLSLAYIQTKCSKCRPNEQQQQKANTKSANNRELFLSVVALLAVSVPF